MSRADFIPHPQCTVASGDCFTEGRCLGQCRAHAKQKEREKVANMEHRLAKLERIVYGLRLHEKVGAGTGEGNA